MPVAILSCAWRKKSSLIGKKHLLVLLIYLKDEDELQLLKLLAGWPRQVEIAALAREPHRLCYYLYEIAQQFHMLWNKGKDNTLLRFIVAQNRELTRARLQ